MRNLSPTPCTIVTGFLGAGKTTLIRHLLETVQDRRLAVIVNEFGEIGVDGELLHSCGSMDCPEGRIIELTNGCICCTVADDFPPALDKLLAMQPPIDHILIETSGLAIPKPLVQAFNWPSIKGRATVDAVLTVVDGTALADGRVGFDAFRISRTSDDNHDDPVSEVLADQVACADMIILSKSDLLTEAMRNRVEQNLRQSKRAAAGIVHASEGKLNPEILLGLLRGSETDIDNRQSHHDDAGDHEHDDFESFSLDVTMIKSPDELARRAQHAAEEAGVLRIKGYVVVEGKPMRLAFQAVGPRVRWYYDGPWPTNLARKSQLVVIGKKELNRELISHILTN